MQFRCRTPQRMTEIHTTPRRVIRLVGKAFSGESMTRMEAGRRLAVIHVLFEFFFQVFDPVGDITGKKLLG